MATYWYFNDDDNTYHFSPDSDYVYGYGGKDILYGGAGDDTLDGGAGNDDLYGESGNDKLLGGAGDDWLDGCTGSDTMTGGAGDDVYVVDSLGDVVVEGAGGGYDGVGSYIDYTLTGNVEALMLVGTAATCGTGNGLNNYLVGNGLGNILKGEGGSDELWGGNGSDSLYGGSGDDWIYGEADQDELYGDAGNDILDGGPMSDHMYGGAGNDQYYVDWAFDVAYESTLTQGPSYIEQDTGGTDTVWSSVTYVLGRFIENLFLSGTAIFGTGNDLANVLTGNELDNTLQGNGGNDTLKGGQGDDFMYGGSGNDTLYGEEGNDLLDGDEGNDIMLGGTGDDVYRVTEVTDKVYETTTTTSAVDAGGTDRVESYVDYTLGKFVEKLDLIGGDAIRGTGNDLLNVIKGNDEANILDGKAGNDEMLGGKGSDTYYVDSQFDDVVEYASEGTDTIFSSAPLYILYSYVEVLKLTGSAGINGTGNSVDNDIYGNSGNNTLKGYGGEDFLVGGLGNDIMEGGEDNDSYSVNAIGDVVIESPGGGLSDSVRSSISYTLGNDVEHLYLIGSAAINGTGNGLPNGLDGNSGNNVLSGWAGNDDLDGGAGSDTMYGGSGDDIYWVDSTGDKVYETAIATSHVDSGGYDIVYSKATFTLGLFVEKLDLSGGTAIRGTGNDLPNVIQGNDEANILDGKAGNDSMLGGIGSDTYYVDSQSDSITEIAGEGTDTVFSSAPLYTLSNNVENLTLTGSANVNGKGNGLDNALTGNSGNNGLTGDEGNDILDGGAGIDILVGGDGDDTYYVTPGDAVIEFTGAGADTVYMSSASYGLTTYVENLILTGIANIDGVGNVYDNYLIGNTGKNKLEGGAGNDILNGGAGSDTLIGGAGDDTYWVDAAGDVVTEESVEGTDDTIYSSVSYTLAADCYCEHLYLNGTAAINATGNALDNHLYGNAKNNILSGGAGYDVLYGGAGNDTLKGGDAAGDDLCGGYGNDILTGGEGNDYFIFDTALNAASNKDTITDMNIAQGDEIHLSQAIFTVLGDGNLSSANFHKDSTNTAGGADDFILYNTATGALLYDADGNTAGGVAAVQFATLTGRPDITAADFFVFS